MPPQLEKKKHISTQFVVRLLNVGRLNLTHPNRLNRDELIDNFQHNAH